MKDNDDTIEKSLLYIIKRLEQQSAYLNVITASIVVLGAILCVLIFLR